MQLCVFLLMQRRSQLMALSATSRHTTPVPLSVHPHSVSAVSYHSGPARNTVHSHKMPSGRRGRGRLRTEVQSNVPGEITAEHWVASSTTTFLTLIHLSAYFKFRFLWYGPFSGLLHGSHTVTKTLSQYSVARSTLPVSTTSGLLTRNTIQMLCFRCRRSSFAGEMPQVQSCCQHSCQPVVTSFPTPERRSMHTHVPALLCLPWARQPGIHLQEDNWSVWAARLTHL